MVWVLLDIFARRRPMRRTADSAIAPCMISRVTGSGIRPESEERSIVAIFDSPFYFSAPRIRLFIAALVALGLSPPPAGAVQSNLTF